MSRSPGAARPPLPGPAGPGRVRRLLDPARALWRDFTGESAYDRYVLRHRLEHPGHEPMSERRFWRARIAVDEGNVQSGCC
ncbi:CstA-like transporter-associated (seleno)protein [Propionibacterium acidifaciens]|uniref:PF04328 family protein n=1 Tax=Propionibacterium acidifaciens F0233 TaxID=553198 RepID=U2RQT6_9ACTN|nr:YbdD/YjiX family protein [Propionibacterium acidifaciens]AYW78423.1 YbdD/YjiX family protein [Propionibacterium acidifaciens]ERK55913.1 PF04328 family protein [Propionibacterium acidifaciens F0233]